ncbi:MAG: hypothetical protein M1819_001686 [Sarea resinae]|nr:MAG: hypothetical protein M1819_001686 [Sarea resinae]
MTLVENTTEGASADSKNVNDVKVPIVELKRVALDAADAVATKSAPETQTSKVDPARKFELEDHPIGEYPPIKVAVIGAGLSGITAGALLPVKVPGIDLTIYEKNTEVSGTWLENVYPGVRCDIPANVYQSTFSPKTQWTEEYARGEEIREYWQSVARKHNVYQYIKFRRQITKAEWSEDEAKWVLDVKDLETGDEGKERYDFVVTAIGHFNAWKFPDYPGINDFKGHLRHSSNWDPSYDPTGKKIAVIGNGASGIQIVPQLQKVAQHLDHYARSRTWIAGSFGGEGVRTPEPKYFTKEQLKAFEDPETYHQFRKELETKFFKRFGAQFKGSKQNETLKAEFLQLMAERLKERPEILDEIVPDFSPHCRRLTPGPGYLEALQKENVSFIRTPIERFTETGIRTTDGVERQVDAIICATGANVERAPPFSIIANGIDLKQAWRPDGLWGFPYSYLGVATPSFPNLLFLQGPNASGASGTIPHSAENQATYIAKLLRKAQHQGIKTIVPQKEAADDFVAYSDAFFPRTVLSQDCSSWANGRRPGARIHGLWPGSASHVNYVRRDPRWEDYEYTYKTPSGNRFAYFGNGWTRKELEEDADLTPYLKLPEQIDLRSYHEDWFEVYHSVAFL